MLGRREKYEFGATPSGSPKRGLPVSDQDTKDNVSTESTEIFAAPNGSNASDDDDDIAILHLSQCSAVESVALRSLPRTPVANEHRVLPPPPAESPPPVEPSCPVEPPPRNDCPIVDEPPTPKVPPPLPGEEYEVPPAQNLFESGSTTRASIFPEANKPAPIPPLPPRPESGPPSYNDVNNGLCYNVSGPATATSQRPEGKTSRALSEVSIDFPASASSVSHRASQAALTPIDSNARSASVSSSHTRSTKKQSKYVERRVHIAPFSKFFLFFSNLFGVVVGLAMIGVGGYSSAVESNGTDLSGFGTDPAALLIAIGCVVFMISFCGMVGSLREHIILLKLFHGSLFALILGELIGGMLVYFLQDKVKAAAADHIISGIKKYETGNVQTGLDDAIKGIQLQFQCCGGNQPTDWRDHSPYYRCSSKEVFQTIYSSCSVPSSCCRTDTSNNQCGYKVFSYPNMTKAEQAKYPRIENRETVIYTAGCVNTIYNWLRSNWVTLAVVCGVIVLIEVIGIDCARRLLDSLVVIKKYGSLTPGVVVTR